MSIFDDESTTMSTMLSNEGFGVMDAPMAGSLLPSFSSAMSWPESFRRIDEVAWYQWDPHYQPHADEDEHQSSMRKMKEAAAFNEWVQRGSESSHAQRAADRADGSSDKADSFLRMVQVHGGPGGPSQANTRDERLPLPIPGTGESPGDIGVTIPGAGPRNPDYIPPADPDPGDRGSSDDSDNRGGNSGTGNPGTDEAEQDETDDDNSGNGVPNERLNPPEVPASFPDDSDTDTGGQAIGTFDGKHVRIRDIARGMGYDPYSEPGTTLTADFDDHLAWKSDTPGIDYITDQPVRAPRAGLLTYEDRGDSGRGFHAKILHVDEKDGTYATTTIGHLERPENADDLIRQPETFVEAGEVIGEMGNTGGVRTTDGGTQESAPVTPEQRARGLGAHVHHDRNQASRGGFVDPRGENDD